MKIGPLFKWFGSKWQSAKRYPSPEHGCIIEPFAGGAGYSLNHVDRNVTLWDADPNVGALWRWLIDDATPGLVRDIPVDLPIGTDVRAIGLSAGQALLLKHWQRTNNVGDCWTISPWGHLPGQWTENTRARVAEEIHAVKHWEFYDFSAVPWGEFPAATWFVDPPYMNNYRYRRTLTQFNHEELADSVRSISSGSLVIVCEAADKATGALPGYLPFARSHSSVTSRRKSTQSHHSSEALYVRLPH